MRRWIAGAVAVVVLAGGVGLVAYERHRAQQNEQDLNAGMTAMVDAQRASNDQLRAQNADLDRQIIQHAREGRGVPTAQDLRGYVSDLTWAKTQIGTDDPMQRDLDRDIAWCQRRLKTAK